MGDNSSCKIVRVGEVRIKMFDGSIHITPGVQHVPNLWRSLFSLGKFHENSCELSRRKLIITKGTLVVAKEELKNCQHRLRRKTMIGEPGVTSVMAE